VLLNTGCPPAGSDYLVIGHESLAQVVEVGPSVSRVNVGDLVVQATRTFAPPVTIPNAVSRERTAL
jgi:glucose 1-dehydrogenase